MMRRIAILVALAALTASCSSGGGDDNTADSGGSSTDGAAADSGDSTSDDGASQVSCPDLLLAAQTMGFGVQILAQLDSAGQYDLVREGAVPYDPTEFGEAIDALSTIEGLDNQLGNGTESLARFSKANDLVIENLKVADPFTEAKGEELIELTGELPTFVGGQSPVNFALDEACP